MMLFSSSRENMRVLSLLVLVVNAAISEILPTILWNPDNPIFQNLGNEPRAVNLKDKLTFLCPNLVDYIKKKNMQYSKENQYANIYRVDKAGYDSCNATGGLKIMDCKDPLVFSYTTIVIQESTAVLGVPEFSKGKTYYFIDTSSGTLNTVNDLVGGRCDSMKLKMKLYVCTESDPKCPVGNEVVNGGWSEWGHCQRSGIQHRQCNSPSAANGGTPCSGSSTRSCTPDATPTPYNNTVTPKKEKQSLPYNTLSHLSAGALGGIFLAVFIAGCVLGAVFGAFSVQKRNKINRRKAQSAYNRNSVASTAPLRPMSTGSLSDPRNLYY